jgi:LysR family glycine cleavage system transcriptional activator
LLDDFAYYLVYPNGSEQRPKVAAFRDWILSAASRPLSDRDAA